MALDRNAQARYAAHPLWQWRIANRRESSEIESWLGLPRGRVSEWEIGSASPDRREMRKLARWTGIADLDARWSAWSEGRSAPRTAPARAS